ncbi:hypothetical protein sphantq_03500 [Sphingobium sp. AntQ-1]|nr:hypothetical protein sphantq_03500 [Sphingobium sp. AntQ-1]
MCEGRVQRRLELLNPIDRAESPLRIRMRERVGSRTGLKRDMILKAPAGCKVQQCLGRFVRERRKKTIDAGFVGRPNSVQPVARHADVQQVVIGKLSEGAMDRDRRGRSVFNRLGVNETLFGSLDDFDQLHRAGAFMRHQSAPLRPAIGIIVMPDPCQQGITAILMQDDPDVLTDTGSPETRCRLDTVKRQAITALVLRKIKSSDLHLLLLGDSQAIERFGKGRGVE